MDTNRPRPYVTPTTDDGRRLRFAIDVASQRVGWISLTPAGPGCLLVRGTVAPDHRGQGVATAALATVCALVARRASVSRLVARVGVADGAAQRVLESNGFLCADVGRRPLLFELVIPRPRPRKEDPS